MPLKAIQQVKQTQNSTSQNQTFCKPIASNVPMIIIVFSTIWKCKYSKVQLLYGYKIYTKLCISTHQGFQEQKKAERKCWSYYSQCFQFMNNTERINIQNLIVTEHLLGKALFDTLRIFKKYSGWIWAFQSSCTNPFWVNVLVKLVMM